MDHDANKMKEINIKSCIYYYWDDVIYINDLTFKNIFVRYVLYKDLSISYVKHKIPYSTKDLCIIFRKINACITNYDGSKCLTLLPTNEKEKVILKKYNKMLNKIKYLIKEKEMTQMIMTINTKKLKITSDDDLPLEKILEMCDMTKGAL